MTELRDRMKNHVTAAKKWLSQAEQSLEQNNEIKGNLNLMLAQAELKRAQETKAAEKRSFGYGSLLIHSMLVTGVVGVVLVVGFSGFNLGQTKPVVNAIVPIQTQSNPTLAAEPVIVLELPDSPILPQAESLPEVAAKPAAMPQRAEKTVPASPQPVMAKEQTVNVTAAQMQQLLRAAGKSLRGAE